MNTLLKSMRYAKRRGAAVPLAVVAIVVLLLMGAGLLSLGFNSRVYATRTSSDIAARCAADAGVEMALFEMNRRLYVGPWDDSALPQATNVQLLQSNQVCSYAVKSDGAGGYTVLSYGEFGGAKRMVRATLGLKGIFEHAILTKSTLVLKSGTVIDAYNSLDPLDTSGDADIGTQSTLDSSIVLNAGVTVDGDVTVGFGGNPETVIKDQGATVTGNQYPGTSTETLPEIAAPTDLIDTGKALFAQGQTITATPSENGQYSDITLKSGDSPGILRVEGGNVVLHITGDIQLGQSCQIVIADGSTLTLYVDGNIHCRESSGINTENPTKEASILQIYGTSDGAQSFELKANGQFTGAVYAPNADVDLYAGGDVYGAVVGDSFEFKAGGNYHYDEALRQVDKDDAGVRYVVRRWEESIVLP